MTFKKFEGLFMKIVLFRKTNLYTLDRKISGNILSSWKYAMGIYLNTRNEKLST